MYHGADRDKRVSALSQYDVVRCVCAVQRCVCAVLAAEPAIAVSSCQRAACLLKGVCASRTDCPPAPFPSLPLVPLQVITTYNTLAAEMSAKNGVCRVDWLRVVLDEVGGQLAAGGGCGWDWAGLG